MKTNIVEMNAAGSTRDEIIIAMVMTDKMSINAATKAYAAVAKAEGWSTGLTSYRDEAAAYLGNHCQSITVDEMHRLKPMLMDEFGVAESTATDYLKAHCELLGEAYPVLNPREAIFAWFKTTKDITKEGFMDYAVGELGRSQSNANEYWKGYELHLHLVG